MKDKKKKLICLCNAVPQEEIEKAIQRGCHTVDKIGDATNGAGFGACGGSCRPDIEKLIQKHINSNKKP